MNLIWVPNQQFALYFLAYLKTVDNPDTYRIFVQDEHVIDELKILANQYGVNFVDRDFATSHDFEELYLFSFGILSFQEDVKNSVSHSKLWLFGDHLNNTNVLHSSARKWQIFGLLDFGYELIDLRFDTLTKSKNAKIQKRVVPFRELANVVKKIQDLREIPNYSHIIGSKDCLVLERYWGHDRLYPIKDVNKLIDYIGEVSQKFKSQNIILKASERTSSLPISNIMQDCLSQLKKYNLKIWEDFIKQDKDFGYLTSPEALILGNRITPGEMFAFDSSTSIAAASTLKEIQIVWGDVERLADIFQWEWTELLVREKIRMYKDVVSKLRNEFANIQVETEGVFIREFLFCFIEAHYENRLANLTQEKDALTQEKDALTQEKDALTQEKDALTQEKDALTQEKDALTQEKDALTQEKDALTQEKDALTQEKDALTQEKDALTQEKDALTQEKDALTQEKDALTQELVFVNGMPLWAMVKSRFIKKFEQRSES